MEPPIHLLDHPRLSAVGPDCVSASFPAVCFRQRRRQYILILSIRIYLIIRLFF
jgi:hypothetical protein